MLVPEGSVVKAGLGQGDPTLGQGSTAQTRLGSPGPPAAAGALTACWFSDSSDWRQGNSRSFPELGQLADPFNFGKIQQDNFPEHFY